MQAHPARLNVAHGWRYVTCCCCLAELLLGIILVFDGTFAEFAYAGRAQIVGGTLALVGALGVLGAAFASRTILNAHLALVLAIMFLSYDLNAVVSREGLVDCSLAALYARLSAAESMHNAIHRTTEGFSTVTMRLNAFEGALDDALARAHAYESRPLNLSASNEALASGEDEKEDLAVLLGSDAGKASQEDLLRRTFEVTDGSFVKNRLGKLERLVDEARRALEASKNLQRGNVLHADDKGAARGNMMETYLSHLDARDAEVVVDAVAQHLNRAETIARPIIARIEALQERTRDQHRDEFAAAAFDEIGPDEYERLIKALDMAYGAFDKAHDETGVPRASGKTVDAEVGTPEWLRQLKGEIPVFHTAYKRLKTHAYASMPIADVEATRKMWKDRWESALHDVSGELKRHSERARKRGPGGIDFAAVLPSHCHADLEQRAVLSWFTTALAGLAASAGYLVACLSFLLPSEKRD